MTMKTNATLSDSCKLTTEILSNIAHRIDITGTNRSTYVLWINDVLHFNTMKTQKMSNIHNTHTNMSASVFSTAFAQQYGTISTQNNVEVSCLGTCIDSNGHVNYDNNVNSTLKQSNIAVYNDNRLYILISKCLLLLVCDMLQSQDRTYVLRGMDILCQLTYSPDNNKILTNIPSYIIQIINDYIYCNITTTDPLHLLLNKTINTNTTSTNNNTNKTNTNTNTNKNPNMNKNNINNINHITPGYICMNYHIDVSDVEIRDMSLELIYGLCHCDTNCRQKFGSITNFIKFLCHIIETYTNTGQQIGLLKICHNILLLLMKEENNKSYILLNQITICGLSCCDEYICDIMINNKNIYQDSIENTIYETHDIL